MVKLQCGCEVGAEETLVPVRMKDESICMFEGFVPSVRYFSVCNQCYEERYSKYESLILTDKEEEEWLSKKLRG